MGAVKINCHTDAIVSIGAKGHSPSIDFPHKTFPPIEVLRLHTAPFPHLVPPCRPGPLLLNLLLHLEPHRSRVPLIQHLLSGAPSSPFVAAVDKMEWEYNEHGGGSPFVTVGLMMPRVLVLPDATTLPRMITDGSSSASTSKVKGNESTLNVQC